MFPTPWHKTDIGYRFPLESTDWGWMLMQPFHQIPLLEDCDFRLYGEDMNHTPDQIVVYSHVVVLCEWWLLHIWNLFPCIHFISIHDQSNLQLGGLWNEESRAIIRYIAEKYEGQGAPLLGKTLKERALVNQWVEVEGQNFFAPFEAISLESFKAFYFKRPLDKQLITSNFEKLEKVFNVYEAQLSRNKYLAGDHYSIADLVHTPSLRRLKRVEVDAFAKWKHVTAWYEDIRSRPAFQKVLEWDSKWPFVKPE